MIDARRYLVHDLPEWLEITTKELAPTAKERIRLEIEAHHAEAVAAHLAGGLSESVAGSEALADLGSPDEAAKRFRKQHLTIREANEVERRFKAMKSRWRLLYCYPLFCVIWFWAEYFYGDKQDHRSFAVLLALGFTVVVIFPTVGFIMMRRKSKRFGLFFLIDGVAVIAFGAYMQYFMNGDIAGWVFGFCLFCSVAFPILRAGLKLQHVANVWNEIPPQS